MLAIEVRGVHKAFRIPHERRTTLTERLMGLLRPVSYERFEVLRGVDLEVPRGSFVGIVGNNGSGKSTLLKIIAGLLEADGGSVRVNGSVSALLELGLGFHPELTVEENVELYGTLLGYPPSDLQARVDAAIAFAEIERFRDAKLKNLSTGMQMRLAFATALQASSEIMLLDEILAVGDASFQRKCLEVFADLKAQGVTVLLVSHNLDHVRRLCDHAVLLESGRVAAAGVPDDVIGRYLTSTNTGKRVAHLGDGQVRIEQPRLEDRSGGAIATVCSGDAVTLVLRLRAVTDVQDLIVGLLLRHATSVDYVYGINTRDLQLSLGTLQPGTDLEIRITFLAALRDGRYTLDAAVADRTGDRFHDWLIDAAGFEVTGSACAAGLVDLRAEFEWHRLGTAEAEANPSLLTRVTRTGTS